MKRSQARSLLGLLLGAALMAWFLCTTDWPAFAGALAGVRLERVILAAIILFGEFALRSLRWRLLLQPVAPNAGLGALFSATLVGAASNTLLPARAGDLARPLIAHRRTGAPLAPVVTTTVMERIFDLMGLLFVFLLTLALLPQVSGPEGLLVEKLRRYGFMAGGAGCAGFATLLVLSRRRDWMQALLGRLFKLIPAPVGAPLLRISSGLVDGLAAMASARQVAGALALTLLLWFNGAFAIYILFSAFDIPLPFGAASFTAVAIALAVVLPQAPGFVGVFHVAIEKTLVLWGLEATPAKGFAVVFWGISFLPVTTAGLLALWREGLSLGSLLSRDKPGLAETREK